MHIAKPFDWLTRWTRDSVQTPRIEVIPVIQPCIETSVDWPLPLFYERLSGSLSVGETNVNFPDAWSHISTDTHHHQRVKYIAVEPGGSVALAIFVRQNGVDVARLYNGSAASVHYPPISEIGSAYTITDIISLHFQFSGASGGENYRIDIQWWGRRASDPLPLTAY